MPDTEIPAPVAEPSTAPAQEPVTLSKSEIEQMLKEAAKAGADAATETVIGELKKTDPATRPKMPTATAAEDERPGPGYTEAEARHINKMRRFMPGGTLDLKFIKNGEEGPGVDDRPFYKSVNLNTAPRGEVMDNFSVGRLCYSLQRNGMQFVAKDAKWEAAYYEWVEKAQGESNGQDGGFLAPEEWVNTYYGVLRPSMVLSRLPVTFRPVAFRVSQVPVVTGDVTVGYFSENASLTASQFQYSQHVATMRKQAAFVQIPNELLRDWLPAAENNIRVEAARAMARDREKQALVGNGQAGAPFGVLNMTNVTSSSLGATPTFANLNTGILNVKNLNSSANVPTGEANCTGIVGSVQLQHTMLQFKDSQNRPLLDMSSRYFNQGAVAAAAGGQAGAGDLGVPSYGANNATEAAISSTLFDGWLGVPRYVFSNLIAPGNSAQVLYGDWQYLVIFQRQDIEIMSSNVAGTAFQNDQTWVRLIARWDAQVIHPEAFFIHTNAQP